MLHLNLMCGEHVDDVGPLARDDVGRRRNGRCRHFEARLQRQGNVPRLVRVLDPHGAGDFAQLAREVIAAKEEWRRLAAPPEPKWKLLVAQRMRSEARGFGIGVGVQLDQLCGVAIDDLQQRTEELVVAGDARLVVLQHMQLDEHAGAVLENHVAGREARRIVVEAEALRGIGVVVERDVGG